VVDGQSAQEFSGVAKYGSSHGIEAGDKIVIYSKETREYIIGTVTKEHEHNPSVIELGEVINKYEKNIDLLISQLDIDIEDKNIEEESEEVEKRSSPNYGDYIVDTNVEHTLYENFTPRVTRKHLRWTFIFTKSHLEEIQKYT
jgi:hypothetical protein